MNEEFLGCSQQKSSKSLNEKGEAASYGLLGRGKTLFTVNF